MNKAPVRWYWRPAVWPVWNHHIREPLRVWSVEGPDEQALDALGHRQTDSLRLPAPSPAQRQEQVAAELDAARAYLRQVRDQYWQPEWRRAHKGFGIYPESHLWDAVWGYLNLLDTTHQVEQRPHGLAHSLTDARSDVNRLGVRARSPGWPVA